MESKITVEEKANNHKLSKLVQEQTEMKDENEQREELTALKHEREIKILKADHIRKKTVDATKLKVLEE